MGRVLGRWREEWREFGLALAFVALLVNVLVPPGYMAGGDGHGPALVICSAQGPVTIGPDGHVKPLKSRHSGVDSPCAFAGHGVAAAPTPIMAPAVQTFAAVSETAGVLVDLTPGRGLAAPPPPSQAPPKSL